MIPDQSKYQSNLHKKQKADSLGCSTSAGFVMSPHADVWNKQSQPRWRQPTSIPPHILLDGGNQDTNFKRVCFLEDNTEDTHHP